jgi:YHS domain-containing protein
MGVTACASAASHLQIVESGVRRRGVRHVNSGDSGTKRRSYDPICGVAVESGDRTPSSEYKKRRYFFCSEKCKHEFERAAERIRMQEAARAGALFTHGKVRWGLA